MRDLRVVKGKDGSYINISRNQSVNAKVKKMTGLTNLDATISFRKRSRKSLQKLYADRVRVLGFERNDGSQVLF